MPGLLQPPSTSKSFSSFNSCLSPAFSLPLKPVSTSQTLLLPKNSNFSFVQPKSLIFLGNSSVWRRTHVSFCSQNDDFEGFLDTHVSEKPENEREELELRGKPSPLPGNGSVTDTVIEPEKPGKDEVLAPFMKFFKSKETVEDVKAKEKEEKENEKEKEKDEKEIVKKVGVEYYDPKPGDFVVGVVVSGNENKLDVNIAADFLGTMLTKEVLPLYDKELPYLLCDLEKDSEEFMVKGKIGIVLDEDAVNGKPGPGRPIVEVGTVLFAEVLGRTLSGRPLLSTRRLFRRVAWHRVRQIKQFNEPIEVKITEWNTGGLLTRIEGLRAFIPKAELMNRANNFTELKENVGRKTFVRITRINEDNNELILSERVAWEMLNLQEGKLLEGTVRKIFPYGAQVMIGDTNRSGLLHISNITRGRINSVNGVLTVDEKVKVLVGKSAVPDKISLSIADLESEPGLFLSNKERVYAEAEEMAKKYRQKLAVVSTSHKLDSPATDDLPFDDEEKLYANWQWFKFQKSQE